ncbi:MAG: YgjV family protein [Methanobrevibacter sp.]|jgi:hypothetical protein|nr:YgjV family protein [Methanobrevibacter sp.]
MPEINIVATVLGYIGLIFAMTSMLAKEKDKLIAFQFLANSTFAAHFYTMNAYTGSLGCLSVGFQSLVIYFYNKYFEGKEVPDVILYIFLFMTLTIDPAHTYLKVLPNIATVFTVYSLKHKNIKISKVYMLIVCLLWITYDLKIGEVTNLIAQVGIIISIIGSYLIYTVFKKESLRECIPIFKKK